jgi:hypothetical protein
MQIIQKEEIKMTILIPVEGTTKSGRTWLTQVAVDSSEDLIKQMKDNYEQLDYERSQLL